MKLRYSAPGKLFISGEWAILELGTRGIVAAVSNRVHVEIESLGGYDGISITALDFGVRDARAKFLKQQDVHGTSATPNKLVFMNTDEITKEKMRLLGGAISTALVFLENHGIRAQPFKITTDSSDTQIEVNGEMKKVGFGSSAAVIVAAIAAVLDFHGYKVRKDEVYKLATVAHFYGQGKVGSSFDVAASAYGGVFVYSRFDPDWLVGKIESGEKISIVVSEDWPGLVIEELSIPENLCLLVGWTKESASTSALVKEMNEYKRDDRERYVTQINYVASCANSAVEAWQAADWDRVIIELQNNREALSELSAKSMVNIETPSLRKLALIAEEAGAAGKLSGAGGGDCGIAVCFDNETKEKIIEGWEKAGLHLVPVTLDMEGVRKED